MDGSIQLGDALRLKLRQFPEALIVDSGATAVLRLNSPGGDYSEAMEIIETISFNGIATSVGAGDRCLFACALIFMAGLRFEIERPDVLCSEMINWDDFKYLLRVGNGLSFRCCATPWCRARNWWQRLAALQQAIGTQLVIKRGGRYALAEAGQSAVIEAQRIGARSGQ